MIGQKKLTKLTKTNLIWLPACDDNIKKLRNMLTNHNLFLKKPKSSIGVVLRSEVIIFILFARTSSVD